MIKIVKKFSLLFFIVYYIASCSTSKQGISEHTIDANKIIQTDNNTLKVAVLLPLTGKNSKVGNQILNAVMMTLDNYQNEHIKIYPFDTNQDLLNNSFFSRLEDKKLHVVLGPLFSNNVLPVYKEAKKYNIPVFTLSNEQNFLNKEGLFILGMLPEQHILPSIKFAVDNKITNIAAILPNTKYGKVLNVALKQNQEKYGYKLLLTHYYKPFKGNVLKGLPRAVSSIYYAATHNKNVGILVPEGGKKLELIMKQFNIRDKANKNLTFIGSTQWGFGKAAKLIKPYHKAFVPNINNESFNNFEKEYYNSFQHTPTKISSIAYDITSLLLALQVNNKNYNEILNVNNLSSIGTFRGILGNFMFNQDNSIVREIDIKQIN